MARRSYSRGRSTSRRGSARRSSVGRSYGGARGGTGRFGLRRSAGRRGVVRGGGRRDQVLRIVVEQNGAPALSGMTDLIGKGAPPAPRKARF